MKRSLLITIAALFAFMAGCGDSSDTSLETGGTSPVVAPSAAVAAVPPPPGRFADFTCDPVSGTPQSLTDSPVLSLPDSFSPPAYFIASVTLFGPACSLPYGPLATNPGPGDWVGGRPSEFGCAVGDVFTISFTSLDGPSTAECSWPVIP
ncbi:MAG: hypothetical protein ACI8P9_004215 [Parasphingorhabdus sp.]|jgi:hypothetical protein